MKHKQTPLKLYQRFLLLIDLALLGFLIWWVSGVRFDW